MAGKVWNVSGENCAAVPTVDYKGSNVLYLIVFSLDRTKKRPVDLDLRVRTAYPCDKEEIITHGPVWFPRLVTLRMQDKRPKGEFGRHRPRPTLTWKLGEK